MANVELIQWKIIIWSNRHGNTMPVCAVHARYVSGIKLRNVRISLLKPGARPATVFIDVEGVTPADFAAESSK